MVCQGFGLKTTGTVSPGLASKPVVRGFRFGPQNWQLRFGDLDLKITMIVSPSLGLKSKWPTVCRLCHKTNGRMKTVRGTRQELVACFMWKQVGLGFTSLASRLAKARWRVVHVAPSWRSCADQVKDGRVDAMGSVGPCYPYFAIFIVLGPRGIVVILVFCFGL
jgi:hypothetical protein